MNLMQIPTLDTNWSDGAYTFFTILISIALSFLLYFLVKWVLRERKRYIEERDVMMEGMISRSALTSLITSYISKVGKEVPFYLIYVDFDKYSEIVSAFGQKEADKGLEKLTQSMITVLPKSVKMARYQGDEFLLFFHTDFDRSQIIDMARDLQEVLRKPVRLFGDTYINPTVSIGIAMFPKHGDTIKQLLNSLKIATYIIKKSGGNNIKIYSEDMEKTQGEYVEYYYQIKKAIHNKEFQLYFQPVIDVAKKQVLGAEALLRWNHPEHGVLSPYQFINIMEQSGDIYWVGLWGLETLIKTHYEFKQEFPNQPWHFSMNLSPKQLMVENLPMDFQKLIRKYRMGPENITLEIVEFAIFDKNDTIYQNLMKLKELGFKLAIDGFGLDYATLNKLEQMSIDTIKLDREFFNEEDSYVKSRFATLLVEFAQKNKRQIICEGIENIEMLELARGFGITNMQGYYFGKPMSSNDLKNYVEQEKLLTKPLEYPKNDENDKS